METALRLKTTVLPGHRVEFTAPEFSEGSSVELIVIGKPTPDKSRRCGEVMEFLDSLPERHRTPEEWEAIEREFQAERDSWDF